MSPGRRRLLQWVGDSPDVRHSVGWDYAIVRDRLHELHGGSVREVFSVRRIDEASRSGGPEGWTLGSAVGEESSWAAAEEATEVHAWTAAHREELNVPADYPARDLSRFRRPPSDGTTLGALAIVRRDGRLVAQVLGMQPCDK